MAQSAQTTNVKSEQRFLAQSIVRIFLFLVGTGVILFVSYGGVAWTQAWILLGLWFIYYLAALTYGRRHNPDVILERARSLDYEQQPWDARILRLYIPATLALSSVAGLDAGRYHWSEVSPTLQWGAFPFVLLAYILPFWAIMSNPFASGIVRIQSERGHHAVDRGPYQYVRHPMYAAMFPYAVGFPIFLGSWWALVPGLAIVVLFTIRTLLEDRLLQQQLPGYTEYTQTVRYRLIPGVW